MGGRQGPCHHCKIESSRHWRSGPPEKPVLCNACGCRWAKYHQLDGYVPRHRVEGNSQLKQLITTSMSPFEESNPKNTASSAPSDPFPWISEVQRNKRTRRGIDYDEYLIYKRNWMTDLTDSNETLLGVITPTPED